MKAVYYTRDLNRNCSTCGHCKTSVPMCTKAPDELKHFVVTEHDVCDDYQHLCDGFPRVGRQYRGIRQVRIL